MTRSECSEHKWEFLLTSENWFDGDEEEIYKCIVCDKRKYVYIPR